MKLLQNICAYEFIFSQFDTKQWNHKTKYLQNKNKQGIYSNKKNIRINTNVLVRGILRYFRNILLYFLYGRLNEFSMEIRIKLDDARPASVSIFSHFCFLISKYTFWVWSLFVPPPPAKVHWAKKTSYFNFYYYQLCFVYPVQFCF